MRSTEDLLRRVERTCALDLDARTLRERLLAILRPELPFDGHVFLLTDPVTKVATAPHADLPMLPWDRLPELIRWRYLTLVNRWDELVGKPASSLRSATSTPDDSLLWRHVHRDLGIVDSAMVTFADRYGVWGSLELVSTSSRFTAEQLDILGVLVPTATRALRATVARTFAASPEEVPAGPAVVVLGADLVVRNQTDDAGTALLRLLPPDQAMPPIPAAAYNVGAALLAAEAGVPVGDPWARVHLGGNQWATVRASRLGEDIAVSIEPSRPAERRDLFSRACGLSAREAEVLGLLGVGLDTREIAGQLFVSEHTVNDHVKATLSKTGARSRQMLLARASGSR